MSDEEKNRTAERLRKIGAEKAAARIDGVEPVSAAEPFVTDVINQEGWKIVGHEDLPPKSPSEFVAPAQQGERKYAIRRMRTLWYDPRTWGKKTAGVVTLESLAEVGIVVPTPIFDYILDQIEDDYKHFCARSSSFFALVIPGSPRLYLVRCSTKTGVMTCPTSWPLTSL